MFFVILFYFIFCFVLFCFVLLTNNFLYHRDESNPVWNGFNVLVQDYGGPDGKFCIELFDKNRYDVTIGN